MRFQVRNGSLGDLFGENPTQNRKLKDRISICTNPTCRKNHGAQIYRLSGMTGIKREGSFECPECNHALFSGFNGTLVGIYSTVDGGTIVLKTKATDNDENVSEKEKVQV